MEIRGLLRGILLAVSFVLFALVVSTCGGGRKAPVAPPVAQGAGYGEQVIGEAGGAPSFQAPNPSETTLSEALAELDALPTPEGVDAALFGQLKAALREALLSRWSTGVPPVPTGETPVVQGLEGTKLVSTPPTGEANRVDDLAIADNGDGTYTLTWSYKNVGDYNQDGVVDVKDITPLAVHFNEPADATNEWIDGNGDGVISIQDITSLAVNFLSEFSEYVVERSFAPPLEFDEVAALTLADATGGGAKQFSYIIPVARRTLYRVAPHHPSGETGPFSEPVELLIKDNGWNLYGRDLRHTMRSPYVGPQTVVAASAAETRGCFSWNSVVSAEGVAYVIRFGVNQSDSGIELWAISRSGTVQWTFRATDQPMSEYYSSPAIAEDGTVYFPSASHLLAINADGSLKWESELGAYCYFSSPTIGPDGTIYVGTGDGFDNTKDGHLRAFNPDGSAKWDYLAGNDIVSTAAVSEDGTVYSATYRGKIFALHADGSLKWELQAEGAIWSSPAIAADGTVYIGIQGGRWNVPPDYDTGYLYAVSPDGSLKWTFQTKGWVSSGPAIAEDGTIYAGSTYPYLYAISPDGALKWRFTADSPVWGNPAIGGDGLIYIAPASGNVYAITPDGTLKWAYGVSHDGWDRGGSPVLGEDGLLYVSLGEHYHVLGDGW